MPEICTASFARSALTAVIFTILFAQFSVIPRKFIGKPALLWYWPIIDYTMYERSRVAGESITSRYDIEISLFDGSVHKVKDDDLGLPLFPLIQLSKGLAKGNERDIAKFMSLYKGEHRDEIAEIRVYAPPLIITKTGPDEGPAKLLGTITISTRGLPATIQPVIGADSQGA
jgi:hypothetical protein